ncbi:MAG TPA: tripartite tricarboxylate transporter substrate binding protein [Xanthobacteraceae bacterium]|nr:tripartite tricarboxylate transporter substrate binding protein [Xanthobacteraceae bacterium]
MKRVVQALVAALALVSVLPAQAQEKYPSRPITLVVPFPAGGSVDLTARAVAAPLEKILGQPVVIQNRSGAAGAVGTRAVATADADGYTLLASTAQISVLPPVDEVFGRKPAFAREDFQPIARLSADPVFLAVNAQRPWKTLGELVEDAKRNPGAINYSHGGLYGATHLPVEMFLRAAGIRMQQIPTQGGGPAMTAALGNHVALLVAHPGVLKPHAEAGTMRVLASLGDRRSAAFPDVPTMKELGYDVEFSLWQGLFAPARTPEPVMTVLREAVAKAVETEQFKTALRRAGSDPAYQDTAAFRTWWEKQNQTMDEAVRAIGRIE